MQVEEDPIRAGNALRTEVDLALQINGDAGVIRRGPVPDSGHAWQTSGMGIGGLRFGCAGFGVAVGIDLIDLRILGALALVAKFFVGFLARFSLSLGQGFAVEFRYRLLSIFG